MLISSSGAAICGSPLSGGYAGAKRMLWFMAAYANAVATELDLGIRFQALVPQQMTGRRRCGRTGAEATRGARASPRSPCSPVSASRCRHTTSASYVAISSSSRSTRRPRPWGIKGDYGIVALGA